MSQDRSLFQPVDLLPVVAAAVINSIAKLSHYYALMTYREIRQGINPSLVPSSATGKQAILSALQQLEGLGYLRRKGDLWGFTTEYEAFRNGERRDRGGHVA